MSAAAAELQVESSQGVVRLTLNRPQRRNALSHGLLTLLEQTINELTCDASARVVVLGGAGSVFSSGHDLSEMVGQSEAAYRDLFALCSRVMLGLRRLPIPVIARVHGPAFAAGCQLVAACDLAVAAQTATFATPGVKIGLFCTTPMVPLVRTIPAKLAMQMLLTGEPISAAQALQWGLVNRVVPVEQLDVAIEELTRPIVAASPLTVRIGKQAFYEQIGLDEASAYEAAVKVMTDNACRDDAQEGIGAFLQKRLPQWRGS
ncbi:MAG: enoyl-CoA hydratase [Gemmataceae bacterium]